MVESPCVAAASHSAHTLHGEARALQSYCTYCCNKKPNQGLAHYRVDKPNDGLAYCRADQPNDGLAHKADSCAAPHCAAVDDSDSTRRCEGKQTTTTPSTDAQACRRTEASEQEASTGTSPDASAHRWATSPPPSWRSRQGVRREGQSC